MMNIVLLPGFMADAGLWDDVEPALEMFGPITHGDTRRSATIRDIAQDVLTQAPDRFALIGFSMGGYVARKMVYLAPERIQALVLVATSARGDTSDETRRKAAAAASIDPARFHGLSRPAVVRSLHPTHAGDQVLIERVQAMSARVGGNVFKRQAAEIRETDLPQLATIRCPTLVVAGDDDALRSRAEAEELRDGIDGATMIIINGSGHMIPLERPAELAAGIVSWLRERVVGVG